MEEYYLLFNSSVAGVRIKYTQYTSFIYFSLSQQYHYNDVPFPFILQNKICDFLWLYIVQEHNELIQGIILKNRHLKDIIGKKQTLSNCDQILFVFI